MKGTSPLESGSQTQLVRRNDTRSKIVLFLKNSQNSLPEIQETDEGSLAKAVRDDLTPPLTITEPLAGDMLVRDENTNETYKPLSFIIDLKRKKRDAKRPSGFQKWPNYRKPR